MEALLWAVAVRGLSGGRPSERAFWWRWAGAVLPVEVLVVVVFLVAEPGSVPRSLAFVAGRLSSRDPRQVDAAPAYRSGKSRLRRLTAFSGEAWTLSLCPHGVCGCGLACSSCKQRGCHWSSL